VKIVQLQYESSSAGKQALRLHDAFLKNGIDARLLSLKCEVTGDERVEHLGRNQKLVARLDEKLQGFVKRKSDKSLGLFSYPILGTDVSKYKAVQEADVIYLHWVLHGFLNLKGIEDLAKLNKPVVVFMHDMWTITGGCHYSFDCKKYRSGCGACPIFGGNDENDLSAVEFRKKMKLFSKYDNFFFVSPSEWLSDCARDSLLTRNKPVFHIPNIVDTTIYKPFEKNIAKRILNIDEDQTVISFGAVILNSPYKGSEYLVQALNNLAGDKGLDIDKVTVVVFGTGYNKEMDDMIPFKTRFMGYMKDEYSMNVIYNATDVFVAPSLAETFGLVILEALCCGTPVVGFNVGGIPDLIDHKINGYLANYKDADDLAEGIRFCITQKTKGRMLPQFATDLSVNKHLELFSYMKSLENLNYEYAGAI